jgi:hypothetical protein
LPRAKPKLVLIAVTSVLVLNSILLRTIHLFALKLFTVDDQKLNGTVFCDERKRVDETWNIRAVLEAIGRIANIHLYVNSG